ncbi:MAG: hypothetical protein IT168_32940 [Bryobacterales bacterium]|nr:hypothetical protein [Bryobacterales bacterium]
MRIRSNHRTTNLLAAVLTAIVICPSDARGDGLLRQPVSGLVHNRSTNSIQRINGIPGGAILSEPLPVGTDVRVFAFDRTLRYALAANSAGEVYLVRDPASESPQVDRLPGAINSVRMLALNREGNVAALYSSDSNTLQLVNGLPASPRALLTVTLDQAAAGISAMAVLPDEAGVLIASRGEKGRSKVLRVNVDGAITEMASAGSVRSIAVTSQDSFTFIDSERNELVRVRGRAPGAETLVLAGPGNGVSNPQGVCALDDGSVILVNAGDPRAMILDAEGREVKSVELQFIPNRCELTGPEALMLLNDAGSGPLYVLDPAAGFNVMFVPTSLVEGKQ